MSEALVTIGRALAVIAGLSSTSADIGRIDKSMTDAAAERAALARAIRSLAVSSTEAVAGVVEVPGFVSAPSVPPGGGALPANLGAATDRFGSPVGYCPARVGAFASPGNRIARPGPPGPSTAIAAFVTSGQDRTFQTSCADALAGNAQGDDRVLVQGHHDLLRIRYALAAGKRGKTVASAQMDCASLGKMFLPYDPAADAQGCK